MTSRNWCFTLFSEANLTMRKGVVPEVYFKKYMELKYARYCVLQIEKCPESGKYHGQGYAEFTQPIRYSAIQRFFNEKCHCKIRKGTQQEAIAYCKKEESRVCAPMVWGTPAKVSGGMRTEGIIDDIRSGRIETFEQLTMEYETEAFRYHNALKSIWEIHKPRIRSFTHEKLLPVQEAMYKRLQEQDDRKVCWIYDKVGGCGKSELANWMYDQGETFWVSGGKFSDIFHAFSKVNYNKIKYVVIDLMKCTDRKYIPYNVMESFKNGRAFSPKFDSMSLTFPKMKVIILSNMLPDTKGLSADRWDILSLSRGEGNTNLTPHQPLRDEKIPKGNLMIDPDSESDDDIHGWEVSAD